MRAGRELAEWFSHGLPTITERWKINYTDYDPGWRTPCRLIVIPKELILLRLVSRQTIETRLNWRNAECAHETEHLIIIGPSASSKIHTTRLDGRDLAFGDIRNCVLVDKNVLPNFHAFAETYRQQAKAAQPHASRHGRHQRHSRLRRWFNGDDL